MRILAALLSVSLLSGCGTFLTQCNRKGIVYSGVKSNVAAISEPPRHCWSLVLDVLLSAVADTLLLPLTVPMALFEPPSDEAS